MDKYTSIENIYNNSDVLMYPVVVTEKINGTNLRFGIDEGVFTIGSRNNIILQGAEYNVKFDGYGGYRWVMENTNIADLPEDHIFYGEFFGISIQKGVKYFNKPRKHFVCFDIKVGDRFLNWDDVVSTCSKLGIDTVPEICRGKFTVEQLSEIVENNSILARTQGIETVAEGIVIKPLVEGVDHRGNRLIIKYKSELFQEKKTKPKEPKTLSPYYVAGQAYCTQGRVENTIDKFRQTTDEPISMRDMGKILKLFSEDVIKDADDFPDGRKDQKYFMKGATSGVAKMVKKWLITEG